MFAVKRFDMISDLCLEILNTHPGKHLAELQEWSRGALCDRKNSDDEEVPDTDDILRTNAKTEERGGKGATSPKDEIYSMR